MSIDTNTTAAKDFYKEVRKFAIRTKPWQTALYYDTTPDEIYDITLVSRRAYGNPDETLCIMAAAGLDTIDQPLPQTRLVLPTASQLYAIKKRTGFESVASLRENFKPIWA